MQRFKYKGKTGWGMIFARLLIGHLYETWDPSNVDLIIANPPNPGRNHTTLVIGHAATYDTADDWPFDDTHDPAIIKTTDTAQSAGKDLPGKPERRSRARQRAGTASSSPDRRKPRHRLRRHLHHRSPARRGGSTPPRMGRRLGAWCRARPSALERRQQLIIAASTSAFMASATIDRAVLRPPPSAPSQNARHELVLPL